jgi:hypothetical protein
MKRITTIIICRIATAMVRRSADIRGAEHLADRMEALANRTAERWGVIDDVVAALNNEA